MVGRLQTPFQLELGSMPDYAPYRPHNRPVTSNVCLGLMTGVRHGYCQTDRSHPGCSFPLSPFCLFSPFFCSPFPAVLSGFFFRSPVRRSWRKCDTTNHSLCCTNQMFDFQFPIIMKYPARLPPSPIIKSPTECMREEPRPHPLPDSPSSPLASPHFALYLLQQTEISASYAFGEPLRSSRERFGESSRRGW